jgi:etoposide-induced 2.4 mRNA
MPSRLINFLALLLLSLSSLIFSPLFPTSPSRRASPLMQDRTREIGLWYNLLLSWPVLIVCFLINVSPRLPRSMASTVTTRLELSRLRSR